MRRFYVSMMLLAVSLIATAQDKMTLDARMLVDRQQAAEQTARRGAAADETRVTLVVKVADEGARETYDASSIAALPEDIGYFSSYGKINAKKGLEYLLSSTGIKEVESVNAEGQSAKIYDLQGRQVANPTRGLYIVNGRKVIVR